MFHIENLRKYARFPLFTLDVPKCPVRSSKDRTFRCYFKVVVSSRLVKFNCRCELFLDWQGSTASCYSTNAGEAIGNFVHSNTQSNNSKMISWTGCDLHVPHAIKSFSF